MYEHKMWVWFFIPCIYMYAAIRVAEDDIIVYQVYHTVCFFKPFTVQSSVAFLWIEATRDSDYTTIKIVQDG